MGVGATNVWENPANCNCLFACLFVAYVLCLSVIYKCDHKVQAVAIDDRPVASDTIVIPNFL